MTKTPIHRRCKLCGNSLRHSLVSVPAPDEEGIIHSSAERICLHCMLFKVFDLERRIAELEEKQ